MTYSQGPRGGLSDHGTRAFGLMPLLTRVVGGIVGLLRRTRQEQELDAELQEFLEISIGDKVRAGMSRETATRAARMELGSAAAVKDRVRDVGWENVFETTWHDVRYAARTLRRYLPADSVWPLLLATVVMLAIALVAAYVPARRAARVEPVEALRQ